MGAWYHGIMGLAHWVLQGEERIGELSLLYKGVLKVLGKIKAPSLARWLGAANRTFFLQTMHGVLQLLDLWCLFVANAFKTRYKIIILSPRALKLYYVISRNYCSFSHSFLYSFILSFSFITISIQFFLSQAGPNLSFFVFSRSGTGKKGEKEPGTKRPVLQTLRAQVISHAWNVVLDLLQKAADNAVLSRWVSSFQ